MIRSVVALTLLILSSRVAETTSEPADIRNASSTLSEFSNDAAAVGSNSYDVSTNAHCDGVTDDAEQIQRGLSYAAEHRLRAILPSGKVCRVASRLDIRAPLTLTAYGATLLFDFPRTVANANGGLINIQSSDVVLEGLTIDGTEAAGELIGANRYAVLVQPRESGRLRNVVIRNCIISNLTEASARPPNTSTAEHAIRALRVDGLSVEGCIVKNVSGSGVFVSDTTHATVIGNQFARFGWSGVWLNNSNFDWRIADNEFSGTTRANPSFWGAAIDVMGQTPDAAKPGTPDERGEISTNRFIGGCYRYGQVVRLSSSRHVVIRNNLFQSCDVDNEGGGQDNLIVLTVRDVTRNNGPWSDISIVGNHFIAAGEGRQKAIYAITTSGTGTNRQPASDLVVMDNIFEAQPSTNAFGACVYLHGGRAGMKNVVIRGNAMAGVSAADPRYVPLGGQIVATTIAGLIDGLVVSDNNIVNAGGTIATINNCAIRIEPRVARVQVNRNVFWRFVRDVNVNVQHEANISMAKNVSLRTDGDGLGADNLAARVVRWPDSGDLDARETN